MEIKKNKFNIGDEVYIYSDIRQYAEYQCPFCHGIGYVKHPLKDNDIIDCSYCGGENPVKEYCGVIRTLNKKVCYRITHILVEIDKDETKFQYRLRTFNPNSATVIMTVSEEKIVLASEVE